MVTRKEALEQIAAMCEEAVRSKGTDWPAVRAHVEAALAKMPPEERAELDELARDPSDSRPMASRAKH